MSNGVALKPMSLVVATRRNGFRRTLGMPRKLLQLVRRVRNWPRTLLDHLGWSSAEYICYLRDGSSFEVRGGTDDRHVVFEVHVERVYPLEISAGDVVIDVGGHIGCFAVAAARRGARVLSFEPFPSNFAVLQRNIERNGPADVRAFPYAISDRHEVRELFLPGNAADSGRYSLHPGRGSDTISVRCVPLDEVVREQGIDQIDLLKLDCEGSEYAILYGASDATLGRTRTIVVECECFGHPPEWSIRALGSFLERKGFMTRTRGSLLYARRPPQG
jgi:FkbM family methyltransferase